MGQGNLDLCRALEDAGVSEERAAQAAKSVAGGDRDLFFIKGLLSAMLALMLGLFWLQWQTISKVGTLEAEVAGIKAEVVEIKSRLDGIEVRLGAVEAKLDR